MTDNLIEAQYDITKKSKLKRFYESNKTTIYSIISILIISIISISFYLQSIEKKRIILSENYIQSKIHLENKENIKAINLLKKTILADDPTYSTLSLFLILNHNLINDQKELNYLFDHLLTNNKFAKEVKDLLIYKKVLLNSNFSEESEILEDIKPIINEENLWRPHALLLLGDYFASKKEYLKAKEFYNKAIQTNNLDKLLLDRARSQLILIAND